MEVGNVQDQIGPHFEINLYVWQKTTEKLTSSVDLANSGLENTSAERMQLFSVSRAATTNSVM
jgi:hypothetical protein